MTANSIMLLLSCPGFSSLLNTVSSEVKAASLTLAKITS